MKGYRIGGAVVLGKELPPLAQFFQIRAPERPVLSKKSDAVVHIVDGEEQYFRFGFHPGRRIVLKSNTRRT